MSDEKEKLTRAYQEGQLIDISHELSRGSEEKRKTISFLLSELHNKGDIDLIESYISLRKNDKNGHDFFLARHLLEKALPTVNAPVEQVMLCVQHLTREAGNDLAANSLFGPFIEFLVVDSIRPLQAIEKIRKSPEKLSNFVCPAIIAGTRVNLKEYFGYAKEFIDHETPEVGISAIYALSQIVYPQDSSLPEDAIEKIKDISKEKHEDRYMEVVIKAASLIAKLDVSLAESSCIAVKNALEKGGDQTLHAATEVFAFDANNLPCELIDLVILSLHRVNVENKGSIDNIDFGISELLKKDKDMAIDLLERILLSNPDTLSIKDFDSFVNEILSNGFSALNHLLTRWFISGERVLCAAIPAITERIHGNQLSLEVELDAIPKKDSVTLIFLARKAIGYLFLKPVTMVSIIVSILRVEKDEEVCRNLEELLFDPVLVNYPGSAREYLESRISLEPEHVSGCIESVLRRLDEYLENIHGVVEIPELLPSIRQREAYTRNFNRQMSESYKQAMKGSLIEMIATKSVILYGRTSVNYVEHDTSTSSRMEIPMQEHSVEMEFPRRENLDPFGVDYMLRVFRAERLI